MGQTIDTPGHGSSNEATHTSTRQIVLGVSGSIAAYKAVYLTRLLVEDGFDLWPILTRAATRFVGAISFSTLCGRAAVTDLWAAAAAGEIGHVELAHRADLLLIAPCTADLIARLAAGRADDPLAAVALATAAPILIAPAMESGMWENTATQKNLNQLRARGVHVVPPDAGALGSGRSGIGRMAQPETIREAALGLLGPNDLNGRKIVVTAGPTREAFDPVRFISNASSGKMGYALARAARRRGADVCLISGPTTETPPPGVEIVSIQTTVQLLEACKAKVAGADVLIMAAAPADYRPTRFSKEKLKKADQPDGMQATLEPTPDVLRELQGVTGSCFVVGFAAETSDIKRRARDKLQAKGLDMIVANDVTRPDAGFAVDTNAVVLIEPDDVETELPVMQKIEVAGAILDRVVARLAR